MWYCYSLIHSISHVKGGRNPNPAFEEDGSLYKNSNKLNFTEQCEAGQGKDWRDMLWHVMKKERKKIRDETRPRAEPGQRAVNKEPTWTKGDQDYSSPQAAEHSFEQINKRRDTGELHEREEQVEHEECKERLQSKTAKTRPDVVTFLFLPCPFFFSC